MKNVVVLGKGELAIKICDWFWNNPAYNLMYVVPVVPSPTWTKSLINWCIERDIKWIQSGDYKHLPEFEIDLAFSCFYDILLAHETFPNTHLATFSCKAYQSLLVAEQAENLRFAGT